MESQATKRDTRENDAHDTLEQTPTKRARPAVPEGMQLVSNKITALSAGIRNAAIRRFVEEEMTYYMVQTKCYHDEGDMLMVELGLATYFGALRIYREKDSFVQLSWMARYKFEEKRISMSMGLLAAADELATCEPIQMIHTKYGVSPIDVLGILHALALPPKYEMDSDPKERAMFLVCIDPPGGGMGFELPAMWGAQGAYDHYMNPSGAFSSHMDSKSVDYLLFIRYYVNLIWNPILQWLQHKDHIRTKSVISASV